MNISDEADRRYPNRTPGWGARLRGVFSEGAEWARREALREAADYVENLDDASVRDGVGWARRIRALAEGKQ